MGLHVGRVESHGFGSRFRNWIKILYKAPLAQIKLGGQLSEEFPIGRGTRQRCPLSPALFALVMEPIAQAIRNSSLIEGFQVGTITEKVALYADNMVLFLKDPGPSLKEALPLLSFYSPLAGLKVNLDKSLILPIDREVEARDDPDLPLKWTASAKYLGVVISPKASDYVTLNLLLLLNLMKQHLSAWTHLPLSLVGRINLFKIKLILSILYIIRDAPEWIPN